MSWPLSMLNKRHILKKRKRARKEKEKGETNRYYIMKLMIMKPTASIEANFRLSTSLEAISLASQQPLVPFSGQ